MPSGAVQRFGYHDVVNEPSVVFDGLNNTLETHFTRDGVKDFIVLPSGKRIVYLKDLKRRTVGQSYGTDTIVFEYEDRTTRPERMIHMDGFFANITNTYRFNGPKLVEERLKIEDLSEIEVDISYDSQFRISGYTVHGSLWWSGNNLNGIRQYNALGLARINDYTVNRFPSQRVYQAFRSGNSGTRYTYDKWGRLSILEVRRSNAVVYRELLQYKTASRVVANRTVLFAGQTSVFTYTYDELNQLTQVAKDGAVSETYSWDMNGNRKEATYESEDTLSASFDAADRLTEAGGVLYEVDEDSFITRRGDEVFTYSYRGELKTAQQEGRYNIRYRYDGLHRLVGRFDLDTDNYWLYMYRPDSPITLMTIVIREGSCRMDLDYDENNHMLGFWLVCNRYSSSPSRAYYHVAVNHVGTPVAVYSTSGRLEWGWIYDAFGAKKRSLVPQSTLYFPFGYMGLLEDTDTGLVHTQFRLYEPATGRWLSRDPAMADPNPFPAVRGDPINNLDPLGLWVLGATTGAGTFAGLSYCRAGGMAFLCLKGQSGWGHGLAASGAPKSRQERSLVGDLAATQPTIVSEGAQGHVVYDLPGSQAEPLSPCLSSWPGTVDMPAGALEWPRDVIEYDVVSEATPSLSGESAQARRYPEGAGPADRFYGKGLVPDLQPRQTCLPWKYGLEA